MRANRIQGERRRWPSALLVFLLVPGAAWARELSFEERVGCQRTIEAFYESYRDRGAGGAAREIPTEVLERKVRRYLKQSLALERFWGIRVTAEMLQREMERIARDTLMPGRLRKLYEVLGNDPFVVAECVARPVLVSRLVRNRFTWDRRIHAEAYRQALEERARLLAGGPGRATLVEYRRVAPGVGGEDAPSDPASPGGPAAWRAVPTLELGPGRFDRLRAQLPHRPGEVTIRETREAFLVRKLVGETATSLRVATVRVEKRGSEEWWLEVAARLDESEVGAVAAGALSLPMPALSPADEGGTGTEEGSVSQCVPDDTWDNGVLDDVLEREGPTLVWTGKEMIVWGGEHFVDRVSYQLATGSRYHPTLDYWRGVSNAGAPAARTSHTAVWTGREMIVWGGGATGDPTAIRFDTGGRYDPVRDRWTPTSTVGAPSARTDHTAVWTGKEMIIWGGWDGTEYTNTGGRYDPDLDRWSPMSTDGAPDGRSRHTAVWTGTEMIVWGGALADDVPVNTGGRYDPLLDSWTTTSLDGAPSPRWRHTAVWTGDRLLVWGGTDGVPSGDHALGDGAVYDPATDTWTPMSATGAPSARYGHTAVWTGREMIVWGGAGPGQSVLQDGKRYDPVRDEWSPMSSEDAPTARATHRAVWTGTEMIVWGQGEQFSPPYNTGGRYDPVTDTWRPTSTGDGPSERELHSAVWTGSEMIVWGGWFSLAETFDTYRDSGGRYDPMLDAWTPTAVTGAPRGRARHAAVWTGSEMIVWGGEYRDAAGNLFKLASGGIYDPVLDEWRPTSLAGAPPARSRHTGVWTGSRLLVWGGADELDSPLNTGGSYDPVADAWMPITAVGAPSERYDHTAVWTGNEMIVWGGWRAGHPVKTGGRYEPVTDTWLPTTTTGAPEARSNHTAVWTGNEMIVWGGRGSLLSFNTGARYDPAADSWIPTSLLNAPQERHLHTAVWTGSEMIVWGGDPRIQSVGSELNSGGRYDPVADQWRATSTQNGPYARELHTAVWTDEHMIVWGGGAEDYNTGGRYAVGNPDTDGDGVADGCDCAPMDSSATSVPSEIVNLHVGRDEKTLTWYSAGSEAGEGTVHDVVRVVLSELPVGSGPSETCIASGIAEARAEDPQTPPPGEGYGYVVRGRNACGVGTYGFASGGGERLSDACP